LLVHYCAQFVRRIWNFSHSRLNTQSQYKSYRVGVGVWFWAQIRSRSAGFSRAGIGIGVSQKK